MNKLNSAIAGLLIGAVHGWIYYGFIASIIFELLFSNNGSPVPEEARTFLLWGCFWFGVIPGLAIGLLGGLSTPITLPREFMSRKIGATCCFICLPLAWITNWRLLVITPPGSLALEIIASIMLFFCWISIADVLSVLEKIREEEI